MKNIICCIVGNRTQVETIVDQLKEAGFPSDTISVLLSEPTGTSDFADKQHTKLPEGAKAGTVTGVGAGAILGWLTGVGALAIPGIGPFLAAGPIIATLSGAVVGGATGGFVGALAGIGIPDFEARHYDGKIRGGYSLIAVHTSDREQMKVASDIFRHAGAEDIRQQDELPTATPI